MAEQQTDTRQRVIDAAVGLIDQNGMAALSTNKVAASLGLSWGVLQYHFGNRDGLLKAALADCLDGQLATLEAPLTSGSIADIVDGEAKLLFELYGSAAHRVAGAILAQEPALAGTVQTRLLRYQRRLQARWQESLRSQLPALRATELEDYRQLLCHSLLGLSQQKRLGVMVLAERQRTLAVRAVAALLLETRGASRPIAVPA